MGVWNGQHGSLFIRQRQSPTAQAAMITIHGGPGMQSDYLWELERFSSRQLSVVSYDQHGTGRSQPSDMDYTMGSYIAELEEVVELTGYRQVILFGHSWGALVAVNYAASHPESVAGLILLGPAPLTFQELEEGSGRFQERVARLTASGDLLLSDDMYDLAELLPVYFADPSFEPTEKLAGMENSTVVNAATWMAIGEYDYLNVAGLIQAPTLVLWGEEDPFGVEWGTAVSQAIGDGTSELVLLPECGHFWQECPDRFDARFTEFLAGIGIR